ncbi:hypothetical protein DPMN_026743 [Dreissena polymorpha]|uniref:F5/8 type C domain-containing protein n=1 Tax=Dreissena polymorpha TaxID=45954 RepID=A0A9D4RD13_DREPO|nr:hypothetical protein DPMN_026743 [Dreissena polymorpha]
MFSNTTTTVMFDHVFNARCVRIVPTKRVGEDTAMRFELLGCCKYRQRRYKDTYFY